MTGPTARLSTIVLATTLALLASGCAATRKAYDERIGWMVDGRPPTIRFGCKTKPVTKPVEWQDQSPIPIFVAGLSEAGARSPDELIEWRVGDGGPIAVNVEGEHPETVLARDVVDVLARSGFLLAAGPTVGALTLTAAIAGVRVSTPSSDLRTSTGRTKAAVDVAVKLASGAASEDLLLEGARAFGALSAVASTPEKLVGDAYCTALQSFADTITRPGFVDRMVQLAKGIPPLS